MHAPEPDALSVLGLLADACDYRALWEKLTIPRRAVPRASIFGLECHIDNGQIRQVDLVTAYSLDRERIQRTIGMFETMSRADSIGGSSEGRRYEELFLHLKKSPSIARQVWLEFDGDEAVEDSRNPAVMVIRAEDSVQFPWSQWVASIGRRGWFDTVPTGLRPGFRQLAERSRAVGWMPGRSDNKLAMRLLFRMSRASLTDRSSIERSLWHDVPAELKTERLRDEHVIHMAVNVGADGVVLDGVELRPRRYGDSAAWRELQAWLATSAYEWPDVLRAPSSSFVSKDVVHILNELPGHLVAHAHGTGQTRLQMRPSHIKLRWDGLEGYPVWKYYLLFEMV